MNLISHDTFERVLPRSVDKASRIYGWLVLGIGAQKRFVSLFYLSVSRAAPCNKSSRVGRRRCPRSSFDAKINFP